MIFRTWFIMREDRTMTVNKEMSVLIVDDYKTMLRVIRNLLSQVGFKNVDEATDGQKALDLMKHKEYGLIISDWNMEPMSGLDLLKTVRANDIGHVSKVPFIMITAENKMENVVAAKQAGVSNYIVKPFSAEILKSKMTAVLGEF
jgi:two-component system chemotaxis response regulator CheY